MTAGSAGSVEPKLLEILRCPKDGHRLTEHDGELRCEENHRWAVVRDIPRLLDSGLLTGEQRRTQEAFGYSWTRYPRANPYTEEQWADWIHPLTREDFDGKRVLDVGCGLAGFAEFADEWGASEVVGADLSEAVDAAHERLGDRVDLVQADLHHLPFAEGSFDIAYAIGVLHHLPDPERGFKATARMARPGGLVFAWVYGRENNGWIVKFVDPLRRHVISHLPSWLTKWAIALPGAVPLWVAVKLSKRLGRGPYADYLKWLGDVDFAYLHGVVFDHLVAPASHYIRREEFEGWFERAGLELLSVTWRNSNSWRGLGRVPDA